MVEGFRLCSSLKSILICFILANLLFINAEPKRKHNKIET